MCLLKRARWFEEHLRFVDRNAASLVEESRLADSMAWQARRRTSSWEALGCVGRQWGGLGSPGGRASAAWRRAVTQARRPGSAVADMRAPARAPDSLILLFSLPHRFLIPPEQDFADDYDLAEDEEVESFYFSSAAGRARVVLGNRRYGEGECCRSRAQPPGCCLRTPVVFCRGGGALQGAAAAVASCCRLLLPPCRAPMPMHCL